MTNPDPSSASTTDRETGKRSYTYPPTGEEFPSVTTIIGGTEDSGLYVGPWKARLAAQVAVTCADDIAALKALHGPAPLKLAKYGAWIGAANAVKFITKRVEELAAIKSDAGKYVHAVSEALVLWAASPEGTGADIQIPDLPEHLVGALYDDEPIADVVDAMVTGFINFVIDFKPRFTATESTVFDPALKLAGTLDGRLELVGVDVDDDGNLFVSPGYVLTVTFDNKTGRWVKWSWKEQIETYNRMPLALAPQGELEPVEPSQAVAVLWLRPELPRGYRFEFVKKAERVAAWNSFRHSMHTYDTRENGSVDVGPIARPLTADGTLAPPFLANLREVHGRVINPLVRELGPETTVDDLARFTDQELLALRGIGKKAIETIAGLIATHGTPAQTEVAA
jgi:hypothetical protein